MKLGLIALVLSLGILASIVRPVQEPAGKRPDHVFFAGTHLFQSQPS